MEASHPIRATERVELEIDRRSEGDPIAGMLRAGDGVSRPFVGWLELTSLLQRIHESN